MPCVRQYILEKIRFDKRKEKRLQKADGTWFPFVESDIQNGPDKAVGAMAIVITRQSLSCERIVFIQEPCESHLKKRQYYYKIKRMITYYNKEQE